MYVPARLLGLPAGLLAVIAISSAPAPSQALQWPYNLPAHAKYYPEDETLVKRDMRIQQKLQQQPVAGVRKMGVDAGEKFFLDYWFFEDQSWSNVQNGSTRDGLGASTGPANSSFSPSPPFPLHSLQGSRTNAALPQYLSSYSAVWRIFEKRDFQCPGGTNSCASIGRPNSCCAQGQTCQLVQDTGLGDVGCCPAGEACAGSLSSCASGYLSCPNNPGGGCCIPGYVCVGYGCAISSTSTIIIAPSPSSSSTSISPTSAASPSVATSIVVVPGSVTSSISSPTTSVVLSSSSSIPPSTTITTTTTTTSSTSTVANSLVCSSGFKSCPVSLGGGCCSTDRACARDSCPPLSPTASIAAPLRPTTAATSLTIPPLTTDVACPTGFYACSAYYQGGCCQVGRDCAKTSCPTSASTALVNTDGVTVVAPTGSGITAGPITTGGCASGWFNCPGTEGGGCCPSGYACGSTCTATVTGEVPSQVARIAPSAANGSVREGWLLWTLVTISMALWLPFGG